MSHMGSDSSVLSCDCPPHRFVVCLSQAVNGVRARVFEGLDYRLVWAVTSGFDSFHNGCGRLLHLHALSQRRFGTLLRCARRVTASGGPTGLHEATIPAQCQHRLPPLNQTEGLMERSGQDMEWVVGSG